jgi:hypothetical protein
MMRGSRARRLMYYGLCLYQSEFIFDGKISLPRQLAPLSLHDVVQVAVVPVMHASHTSTHWLRFLASNFLYRWAMQARC